MKTAIIYVRVSTDEQSEKGYSLQHQEERLRQYCQYHNIEVIRFYKEDHSAKTFERPAFNELLVFLKKNKQAVDLLLFLKWDRFSRNAGDAYMMINRLNKLGVEPQAIEQPIDLNIPENKIMLAFYLSAPEVENDRRSLNVIAGMRRAMKEGRHVTTAPKGYKNSRNELNRPIITPGEDAHQIQWVFEEGARGVYTVKDVWRMARRKGLDVGRSNMWNLLRNPIYYGKIFIPAYKDEVAVLVQGQHEALVSEALFYEVQDVLDGKKKKAVSKYSAQKELPLRGFMKCPKCGRNLTGSASKGKGGTYFYYHCISPCRSRLRAEDANDMFIKKLAVAVKEEHIALFEYIMKDYYHQTNKDQTKAASELKTEIEKNRERIAKAQQLMVDGELPAADYREVKARYEPIIQRLERELSSLSQVDNNLLEYIEAAGDILRNLPKYFKTASLPVQQKLVSSICAEKLIIDEKECRTPEYNEVIQLICRLGEDSKEIKKEQASNSESLSKQVNHPGELSNQEIEDLKIIFNLKRVIYKKM